MTDRFGKVRVKRGLIHFMAGKVVSALAGLLAMVLVVRGLTVPEFAGYSVLIALVEVFTALTGMGLAHVVLRYVPELYATHRSGSLRSVVWVTFTLRTLILLVALLVAYACSQSLASLLSLEDYLTAFELFLLVVAFRSSTHFLSQILESTLHQSISQIAFSISALCRCLGMFWLLQAGLVNLYDVIVLEAICDVLACCVLARGVMKVIKLPRNEERIRATEDALWWETQRKPMAKFAITAYLQHLATLPFGGNTNRLVGGVMFGDSVMATFGFAQSLYEYFKRYLPTQLLVGLIRPVVVARFTISRDFSPAAGLCDQALHVNLVLLFGAVGVLLVSGQELLSFLSAGKYGAESVWLLIAMLTLLSLETQRLILEILTQTVQHYELMIPSNLFLSASVLIGITGYPLIGALSFPLANALILVVANMWLIERLKTFGFIYHHNWSGTARILGLFVVATGSGYLLRYLGGGYLLATLLTVTVYTVLFAKLLLPQSLSFLQELVGKNL